MKKLYVLGLLVALASSAFANDPMPQRAGKSSQTPEKQAQHQEITAADIQKHSAALGYDKEYWPPSEAEQIKMHSASLGYEKEYWPSTAAK